MKKTEILSDEEILSNLKAAGFDEYAITCALRSSADGLYAHAYLYSDMVVRFSTGGNPLTERNGKVLECVLTIPLSRMAPAPESLEKAIVVCPQCEGEGGYPDGTDEGACHTQCTRCDGAGWIVNVPAVLAWKNSDSSHPRRSDPRKKESSMSHAAYLRLGVHVADSNITVIREARGKLKPHARRDRAVREPRHSYFRDMLDEHRRAGEMFGAVMTGSFA